MSTFDPYDWNFNSSTGNESWPFPDLPRSRRTHFERYRYIIKTQRGEATCGFEDCEKPARWRVCMDRMVSEVVPARYPRGSERPTRRIASTMCDECVALDLGIDVSGMESLSPPGHIR